jgi:regulator of replication initiation timing
MAEQKRNNNTIYLVIIAILAVVIAYLLYTQNQQSNTIETQEETIATQDQEITQKTQELDQLRLEYARVMEERTQLNLNNDSLVAQVAKLDKAIRELRRTGKLNDQKRKDLEALVATLRTDLEAKDREIALLKEKVDSLGKENQNLQTEKQEMGSQIENLRTTEKQLSDKVAIASKLKAENIALFAVNSKGKERDGNEHKSKNIEKVKLVFTLGQNDVAERNAKDILLKVTDPSGTVLYDLNSGGGIFTFNGEKSFYTLREQIMFDNTNQKIELLYTKGMQFIPGEHLFELFCEGHKIGETRMKVR